MGRRRRNTDPQSGFHCDRLPLKDHTKRVLWAESGGYCQRPECGMYLFAVEKDATGDEVQVGVDWAEMAHIVAATSGGPRDEMMISILTEEERAHHDNIVMLCANCHAVVDKAPYRYPLSTMHQWKQRHQDRLSAIFGTPVFADRDSAREYIEPRLAENRTIHAKYAPDDDIYSFGRAAHWRRQASTKIVPNNAEINRALKANRMLLTAEERMVADEFALHVDQFADRHVLGIHIAGSVPFPTGMRTLLGAP